MTPILIENEGAMTHPLPVDPTTPTFQKQISSRESAGNHGNSNQPTPKSCKPINRPEKESKSGSKVRVKKLLKF